MQPDARADCAAIMKEAQRQGNAPFGAARRVGRTAYRAAGRARYHGIFFSQPASNPAQAWAMAR